MPRASKSSLWDAANRYAGLTSSLPSTSTVVLSLIFSSSYPTSSSARRAELIEEVVKRGFFVEMVEFYTMNNVFYLPEEARWSHLLQYAKLGRPRHPDRLRPSPSWKRTTPPSRVPCPTTTSPASNLDASKLAALLDAINNVDTVADQFKDVVGRARILLVLL